MRKKKSHFNRHPFKYIMKHKTLKYFPIKNNINN